MKFIEMMQASPEALRTHYRDCQSLAYNNSKMAQLTRPGGWPRKKLAKQMGYLLTQLSMVENATRKRKIPLAG